MLGTRLFLVRGCSGSGKSTLAANILKGISRLDCAIFEADMFFYVGDKYQFDSTLLSEAHRFCQLNTLYHLRSNNESVAIISNTFTQLWEMKPYIEIANRLNLDSVHILEPNTAWSKNPIDCAAKNLHGLTSDIIQRQLDRWEELPVGKYTIADINGIFENVKK